MPRTQRKNPFHQPARQWQIRVVVPVSNVAAIEEAFGDLALAILSFEIDEATSRWGVDVITDVSPENMDLPARLALVSGMLEIPTPPCQVRLLDARDWVSEVERSFPPLTVGRFYVHGSHIAHPSPPGKIALMVNAGAAFGSGEHATTSGCLRALGDLSKRRAFRRTLDMGCGSGILTLAMARLWRIPALGVDIDPVSVAVARENALLNQVQGLTQFEAGDGYRAKKVREGAPFDLIVSNILAKPLMRMAPDLSRNLAPGGIAVLSGLLATQERMVMSAHRAQGFHLLRRYTQGGWNTLVLGND
jgi:ribosomal protein L11 methyltransferase